MSSFAAWQREVSDRMAKARMAERQVRIVNYSEGLRWLYRRRRRYPDSISEATRGMKGDRWIEGGVRQTLPCQLPSRVLNPVRKLL